MNVITNDKGPSRGEGIATIGAILSKDKRVFLFILDLHAMKS